MTKRSSLRKILSEFVDKITKYISLQEIPIDKVRNEIREVSVKEGWGGKTIEHFPPSSFFRMYLDGNQAEAKQGMEDWYFDRFINKKFYLCAKRKGGMAGGSLFIRIAREHEKEGIDLKGD